MDNECKMWFGTQAFSTWITAPLSGADSSPGGWNDGNTLLGGNAYQINSTNTHRKYVYDWPASSSREEAQLMQSFYDGTFGRDWIYFQDPLTYDTNVLSARWASPSITCGFEGPSLVPSIDPTPTFATVGDLRLPAVAANYDLTIVAPAPPDASLVLNHDNSLFIPIPDGMQLNIGAFYQVSGVGQAGVFVTPASPGGDPVGDTIRLDELNHQTSPNDFLPTVITKQPGQIGVYLWLGKRVGGIASLTIQAIHARLSPIGYVPYWSPLWLGGQGNGGVRFDAPPTYVSETGVDGGQIQYAASFTESVL